MRILGLGDYWISESGYQTTQAPNPKIVTSKKNHTLPNGTLLQHTKLHQPITLIQKS